jgi:hypothetical protein
VLSRRPRNRSKDGPAFIFVNHGDSLVLGPQHQDDQVRIRRQAARSGCKRRQETDRIQRNRGVLMEAVGGAPIRIGAASVPLDTRSDYFVAREASHEFSIHTPPPLPLFNGYEAMRAKYNFDIADLASFTDVDLGRIAFVSLQDQPTRLTNLLQKQPSSFLSYLPSRYGSGGCLDDAIHCLAQRAGQMLRFSTEAPTSSALYGRALKSLHIAIADEKHRLGADVYCATRLLALYEVSGPIHPFSSHVVTKLLAS